ncbi:nuclease-related domain-containing protein [Ammoniphilus sp. YIM 78166]|uniref:nuclease-related domain-containing protein n=1 Tax=Ammoniphilus sp. YIM 78166 TaxID=1644106 RepID=UPI00106F185F|nr:nuclease-related domain-containing protein [Ammoniphilus sp. YIM 78166]
MIVKSRSESLELKILRSLHVRSDMGVKEENYYSNLSKGFMGEKKFDEWLEPLINTRLVLHDVLLEHNNTKFQIDSLLITSDKIYLFEVKNYEGDFYIESEKWLSHSKNEIKSPLLQLQRNESLFRRLQQDLGYNFTIESYVIFVNPEFHLYQAPANLPLIFPTQLNRFICKIKRFPSRLADIHSKFAEHLHSLHINDSPYSRLPEYHFSALKKGICCLACHKLHTSFRKTTLTCKSCGSRENYIPAVLRSVEEFKLLFPDRKITSNDIYEWCEIIKTKRVIWEILSSNFTLVGRGKSSYYVR